MPEFGAELLGSLGLEALLGGGAEAAASAGAEAGLGAAAGTAGDFGLSELASAGLPFGAGAGELGSVATGLGPAGVSAFGDTGAVLASLGGAGAAGIPLGAEATAAGLPAFAGAGQIGAVSDPSSAADALLGLGASSGTGIDVTGLVSGAASGAGTPGADLSGLTTSNASLITPDSVSLSQQPTPVGPDVVSTPPQPAGPPQPTSFSGTTSVGPSAGTPAGPLSGTGFDTAQPVIGGQAPGGPGAVAPVGAAGTSSADLTTAGAVTGAPKAAETGGKSFLDNMVSGAGKSIQNNWLPALIAGGALGYNVLKGSQTPPAQQAIGTLPAANANLAATALGQIPAAQKIQDKALESIDPVTGIQKQATGAATTALGQGSGLVDKGTSFTNYLPTATLPPDMQAALDSATSAAKTRIISNHGSRGLPTDPKKNSVLAQELAQADRDALTTKSQMESDLLKSGTSLIGAGNQTSGTGQGLLGTGLNAAGTTGNMLGTGLNATQVTNQLVGTGLNATGLTSDIYNKLVGMDKADQKAVTDAVANFAKALGGTQGGLSLKGP